MPTYLCHGFRWHRRSIRYFIVIQNVDDAASEWIVARGSPDALLDQFYELFDFVPPCSRPTRKLSPSPQRIHSRPSTTTSNGTAHTRNYSYVGQDNQKEREQKEKQPILENGHSRNSSGQHSQHGGPTPNRSRSLRQLAKSKRRDDRNAVPPSPDPPETEPDDSVPFNNWSVVKFLEEFDPSDLTVVSGEWAYVADYVVRVDTSVSIADEISRYEARMKTDPNKAMSGPSDEVGRRTNTFSNKNAGWFEQLRDQLQRTESIRWYVVVCGDEERTAPERGGEEYDGEDGESRAAGQGHRSSRHTIRGIVENGFEFRLPEFLSPSRSSEQALRRRRAERRMARQGSTSNPLPENDQPVIPPPPAPIQVVHKMPPENTVKPKASKSSGGLRRLFLRRRPDGPT
ncbi:hypothetical protein F4821DRAFT_198489 [Hypoxylon rubiginosum]|uniref:Uncharacterized protein n=1 Tax=Hypoxylon rubiginosum TaxID=110542 RepID=A0ACC0DEH6_9PEZI|nr:hypothetical protein F4821DRAFT_198489 [Hypoxylon rubiginosum]